MKQMHVLKTGKKVEEENSFFRDLAFKYLPFWPLFLLLLVAGVALSFVYLKYSTPIYESSAAILVKDEKKGLDESKMAQDFNLFGATNIVENEMEILGSNSVLSEVVKNLKLYAPMSEERGWLSKPAYLASPVVLEMQNPDSIRKIYKKVYFEYTASDSSVTANNVRYPLNKWMNSEFGVVKFTPNPQYHPSEEPGKLYFSLYSVNAEAKALSTSLKITSANKQSTVVSLSIKDPVPQRGEKILNEVIKIYMNASVLSKNGQASKTLEFVNARLAAVTGDLGKIEGDIQSFRDDKNVVDISAQSKQYLDNADNVDRQITQIGLQLQALDNIQKFAESNESRGGAIVPSTLGINDPTLTGLLEKLSEAQVKYDGLKNSVGEGHPTMVKIQNEINTLKPRVLENIASQRRTLEANKANLMTTVNGFKSMISTVPQKERQLVEVSRQQNIKNSTYQYLLTKKEEAQFSVNSAVPDGRIVDKASSTPDPVSPVKPLIMLIFPFAALGMGIGFVSMKTMVNGKIVFRTDIEKNTNFPVIGELSFDTTKTPLIMAAPGRSFVMEQFRQLRVAVALGYLGNLPNGNRILVTSSVEGEGKSFVAANLAISLALAGKKVVLVDLDLHQPKISEVFNIDNEFGMTEYLLGTKEADQIIKKMPVISNNLSIISSGTLPPNPSEFILNEKIEKLFNYLNKIFDVLIIDTPPVVPVADTYVIAQYSSAILYVVRHNYTPKVHIRMMDENMAQNNVKNVGIVFNGIKKRGFGTGGYGHQGYGYGYGYNSGYGYGQKGKDKKKVI